MAAPRSAAALAVAAIFVFTAACNSDRASAPPDTVLTDRQISADVAMSEGQAVVADLASLSGSADLTGGNFSIQPSGPAGRYDIALTTSADCSYATGRWTCPPSVENGLTVTRSYAFFDGAGQPMKFRDDLKTASINFQLAISGTVARDTTFSGVVHRTRNVTVSGLLGAETTRRWDGFGASADTNTHRTQLSTRRYAGTSLDSVKAVVFPQPRTQTSYPLSGNTVRVVSYTVTARGNNRPPEIRSVDRRVVVTYSGGSLARLQSGAVVCTLHLDTHVVDNCS